MKAIDLFKCTDSIQDMEQSLLDDGLIGVSGGRVSIRNKLDELIAKINLFKEENEERYVHLSINHPDTELGYAWDPARFSLEKAKSVVLKTYNNE